ncbi:translocase of inner membrane 8 [Oratosquilla oratoria]|uniref:translocase of inner membrane 8 n=1 Tax=Oratosquilla oratoria TaxID=337810 RepID=UPI003F7702B3
MSWFWGEDQSSSGSTGAERPSTDRFDNMDSGFSSSSFSDSSSFGDSLSSGLDFGSSSGGRQKGDAELQSFLALEQQKAQFQAMVHKMNDICWETCMGSPGSKLDSRTETCMSSCVERFIDSTLFITNRFAQLLTKGGGGGLM